MCADNVGDAPGATPAALMIDLRLYVAGGAPNSALAIANLEAICREHLADGFTLEIVNVFEQPLRALADGVVVTPSLTRLSPVPVTHIVGNLSDRAQVLLALGLDERTP